MYEILVGRDEEDRLKYSTQGMFYLGKHYVKMGQTTSLSSGVLMDAARSHVVFVCGKRGSGKSYTMSAMAESMSELPEEVFQNMSVLMIDTMGIFWTMKFENKKDEELLKEWGMKPRKMNVNVFVPTGYFDRIKQMGIPADYAFSIRTSQLSISDWCQTFNLRETEPLGVLIGKSISKLKGNYDIKEIISTIKKDELTDAHLKSAAQSLFEVADSWGLFAKEGTKIEEIATAGKINILDVSAYASSEHSTNIRALVIGLVCQKIFDLRMEQRRAEEFLDIKQTTEYFSKQKEEKKLPVTWIMIDEAHEFLPKEGQTSATKALLTLLREGRQPGVSLVLASQQPGQIHTDVLTQSDIVISHRLTAKIDTDALSLLMQSYMRETLDKAINQLPDVKGAALLFDDTNERIYQIRVRPKMTWHGGSSPTILKEEKKLFSL